MQKAAFSIDRYFFKKVKIDLDNHKSSDLTLSFKTNGEYHEHDSSFKLTFTVIVCNQGAEDEPFVEIECVGIYKFDKQLAFEEIPEFFYRNSIAILFPYVRAYVSIVTTQANVPGVMMPTLNLTSLEKILKENTVKC